MAGHTNAVNNGGMYGGMNAAIIPQAGQYSDMQLLMRDLDKLSEYLAQSRDEWMQVQEGLARIERMNGRLARETPPNGEIPAPGNPTDPSDQQPQQSQPATITSLQTSLAEANARIASLETSYREQQKLQTLFDDSLKEATQRIRDWKAGQSSYITDLHRNYAGLLDTARWETIQAQVTHQAWQDGLRRVSDKLREAVRAREEEGRPFRGRIAALKSENQLLRQMVGWEPPVDSEDEEEGGMEEVRGRTG